MLPYCLTTALGSLNFAVAVPYNGLPLWGKKEASGKWHVDQVQDQDTCKSVDESAQNANPHPQIIDRDSGVYFNASSCSWANNQCLCDTTPTPVIATPPTPSATAPTSQPSPEEIKAFLTAAAQGDLEIVKAWVVQGRDVNVKHYLGLTALLESSDKGHLPVCNIWWNKKPT